MGESKKYYYMRLKEGFFDDADIVALESMPDGILYSNILLKLYLKSLRDEGRLMLRGTIPYSTSMIAAITRHNEETVKKALEIFKKMHLIEVFDSGAIYMLEIQNYIGKSSTEADRKREFDRRKTGEKGGENINRNVGEISEKSPPEIRVKSIEYNTPLPPMPEFGPELQAAFSDWLAYKQEKRQSYTPTGLKSLARQVQKHAGQYGEPAVAGLIQECMGNGWRGIIWDRLKKTESPKGGNLYDDVV